MADQAFGHDHMPGPIVVANLGSALRWIHVRWAQVRGGELLSGASRAFVGAMPAFNPS